MIQKQLKNKAAICFKQWLKWIEKKQIYFEYDTDYIDRPKLEPKACSLETFQLLIFFKNYFCKFYYYLNF